MSAAVASVDLQSLMEEMGLREPLVTVDADGYFVFVDPALPNFAYDFKPADAIDALSWVRHMAGKRWVTCDHLEQFASLATTHFAGSR